MAFLVLAFAFLVPDDVWTISSVPPAAAVVPRSTVAPPPDELSAAAVPVVVSVQPNCPPCERLKREAPALGLVLTYQKPGDTFRPTAFPAVRFQTSKGWRVVTGWSGQRTVDEIRATLAREGVPVIVGSPEAEAGLAVGTVRDGMVLISPATTKTETVTEYVTETVQLPGRVALYGGRTYSGRVCSNGNCSMCATIQRQLSVPRTQLIRKPVKRTRTVTVPAVWRPVEAAQGASTEIDVAAMVAACDLGPGDVFTDIGAGDGRVAIAAVRASGCRAVCPEIDADQVERARAAVEAAGLTNRITILHMDAAAFRPEAYGVTKGTAFLWPETMQQIPETLAAIPVLVTAYHECPGRDGRAVGKLFVYGGV